MHIGQNARESIIFLGCRSGALALSSPLHYCSPLTASTLTSPFKTLHITLACVLVSRTTCLDSHKVTSAA